MAEQPMAWKDDPRYPEWLASDAYVVWTELSEPRADLELSEHTAFIEWLNWRDDDEAV